MLQCVATERLDTLTDHFRKRVDEAANPHYTILHPCCNTLAPQHTHTDPFRDRANEATDPDHIITFVVGGGNYVEVCCSVLQCVAVCCSVLQCVAVCCSVCAVCCSVLSVETTLRSVTNVCSTCVTRVVYMWHIRAYYKVYKMV